MAQRSWQDTTRTMLDRKVEEINLTFFPAGAGNPTFTASSCKGVASIVRNGTAGEWLITLQDTYKRLLSKWGSIQMAASTDLNFQFATITGVGTNAVVTVLVRALAVATPTDIAANANNSVSVTLRFSDGDS